MIYYDVKEDLKENMPFTFILGGRGIGKTYSTLSYLAENASEERQFMYLRRTQVELDTVLKSGGNPFSVLPGNDIVVDTGQIDIFVRDGTKEVLGYGAALSTFKKIRGLEGLLLSVKYIMLDEFISQDGRYEKNELGAFLNMYETINRNRELNGDPPCRFIGLTNSNKADSPIICGLDLLTPLEAIITGRAKKEIYIDREKGVLLHYIRRSGISDAKANTALYKLAKNTNFYDMAIANKFANDSWYHVGRRPIVEYKPMCSIDGMTVWRHKSRVEYYVNTTRGDCPDYSEPGVRKAFIIGRGVELRAALYRDRMFFSDISVKNRIVKLLTGI